VKFLLFNKRTGNLVGEAVILSHDNCYYHLFDLITFTQTCSLEKLQKKFRLQAQQRSVAND
jgi:hypothetical protein